MSNALFDVYDRDVCFYGQLKEDVQSAVALMMQSLDEIAEENEVAARIQLPQLFCDSSRKYYGTRHYLEVSEDWIRIRSLPRIINSDEGEQFIKSRTVFMTVLDGEFEYLSPPPWVYARECDCHGSGVIGSWQYKEER